MALGFNTYKRLEKLLLKTRNILGEGDDTLKEENKIIALQDAANLYGWYDGDGSETTYTDSTTLTVLQSSLIAVVAALDLISSAISYYKEDVISATGGPASANFRSDKLAWLKQQYDLLKEKRAELEDSLGLNDSTDVPGLVIGKVRACADPSDDVCPDVEDCGCE